VSGDPRRWSVDIGLAGVEHPQCDDALDDLLDLLGDHSPAIRTPDEGLDIQIWVLTDDPVEAVKLAKTAVLTAAQKCGIQWRQIREVRAIDEETLDRELETPNLPALIGVQELADLLEVSKQRASQLAQAETFPTPVAHLRSGPVWLESAVEVHLRNWVRRPGRPRRH
jgi:hypothetical protein